MPRQRPRDLERTYSPRQFAAKLQRLAQAVERGKGFTIIEHERAADGTEELEFQLRWRRVEG